MSGLPARFPRASLLGQAAELDSRLSQLAGDTAMKMNDADDQGQEIAQRKFHNRLLILEEARRLANEIRIVLWRLD